MAGSAPASRAARCWRSLRSHLPVHRPLGVWLGVHMHLPAAVRPAIVGREREQAELAAALAGARAGHGRAVLLLGEAGMGKSVLADWLAGRAGEAGMQVARGACSAAGMPPLWPWRRSLAAIGLELPRQEDGAVAGPVGRELMAAAIVEGIAATAARQPLLIVLEDLHWSDPVSVLVARAAAEAAAALPLMLLLTCRDEQDEATQQVRDRLVELPASVLGMLLPPLDAAAVAALAGSIAGPGLAGQAVAGLQARTGMLRAARFALVVHHDDDVREYAYDDPQILNAAARGGWTVLSMRDDFARVWPTDLADSAR
jgi:AAA ATPase domain